MEMKEGMRVWAIRESDDKFVYAYGWGTFIGMFPNPGLTTENDAEIAKAAILSFDAGFEIMNEGLLAGELITEAEAATARARHAADVALPIEERVAKAQEAVSLNPKICLDSGGYVWGAECWWGAATQADVDANVGPRTLLLLDAPHYEEVAV